MAENFKEELREEICEISERESCMTVEGQIGNQKINFLVDTGASCTVVSEKVFCDVEKSEGRRRSKVKGRKLMMANGTPLRTLGVMSVVIKIGSSVVEHEVIGADISDPGILGFDFLRKHHCVISAGTKELYIENSPVQCQPVNTLDVARVCLKETCVLPAQSEKLLEVEVKNVKSSENKLPVLIEPLMDFEEKYGLQVAASLCCLHQEQIVARIMNASDDDINLFRGTYIANIDSSIRNIHFIDYEGQPSTEFKDLPVRRIGEGKSSILSGPGKEETPLNSNSMERVLDDVPEHVVTLYKQSTEGMSRKEADMVLHLLNKYEGVFQKNKDDFGHMNSQFGEYRMETNDAKPIRVPPRRTPGAFHGVEEQEIQRMLELGVIRPSTSPWASPVVLVRKKDGSTRFCVDYRSLNKVITKDCYPLPRIDDCIDSLSTSVYFSSMDLASGYWQLPVREEDKPKTAFVTKSGLYEFNVMPFGLTNAPSTFERCMESILRGCQWKTCLIYLDDVIVFGKTFQEHVERLSEVLSKLQHAGLKLKPSKCHFFRKSVVFLGHLVSGNGVTTDPEKLELLRKWPTPKNVTEVRSFLGFCSYYRRYLPHFYEVSYPLVKLTKSEIKKKFIWSTDCQQSFKELIQKLSEAPILAYPKNDGIFILDTDASGIGIGAVLSQKQERDENFKFPRSQLTSLEKKLGGEERVISFASRSLTKEERNYCVTRRELLAVVYFMKHFRHYLLGRKFLVRSDHHALQWIFKLRDPTGQMARWQEVLANFDFELIYRPGQHHGNADGMSRIPWEAEEEEKIRLPCNRCKKCEKQESNVETVAMVKTRSNKGQDMTNSHPDTSQAQTDSWVCGYTLEELRQEQEKDIEISFLRNAKISYDERPPVRLVNQKTPAVRNLWLLWDSLQVQEGVLYKVDLTNKRLIVPRSLRKEILFSLHNSLLSGHLGMKKVYHKARVHYYWYRMKLDIQVYVATCTVCGKNKGHGKHPRAPLSHLPVGAPMDRIATDLFGPLPTTPRQNKYVLLLTDLYSKWVELLPIPDATAETCARAILNEFISRFGCPLSIHSDQGRNYESELFHELCQLLEIRKTRTSPRHPSGNGQVERFNKTLVTLIRAYLKGKQSDWDLNLGSLAGAYRATPHESTGFTPNCVMLGHENRMPADLLFGTPKTVESNYGEHISGVRHHLQKTYTLVENQLQKAAVRQEENYNTRISFHPFKKGDLVYVRNESRKLGKNPKLQFPYEGPAVVTEKKNDINYLVKQKENSPDKLIHYDKLKPFMGPVPRWIKSFLAKSLQE